MFIVVSSNLLFYPLCIFSCESISLMESISRDEEVVRVDVST